MPAPETRYRNRAFTLLELLVVVVVILIIFAMVPRRVYDHKRALSVVCMSNLKQIGVGFVMYESDYGAMPWRISVREGGTKELIPNGIAADHLAKLTNFIREATTFVCPSDKARKLPPDFFSSFGNTNLSYFVSLDRTTNFSSVLAGDRHLSFHGKPTKPGLFTAVNPASLGWTHELHSTARPALGNLLFADGHVETVRTDKLTSKFDVSPGFTNRLVIT